MIRGKKGSVVDVVIWVIIAFVTIMFLAMWLYGHNLITTAFVNNPDPLIANASADIFTPVNDALGQWLPTIAFIIIVAMFISILVSNFLVNAHPVFFFVHVVVTMVAIVIAASISNRYMELLQDPVLGSTLQQFVATNFIMQWLPYWVALLGIFGAIFLYIGIIRKKDEGVSI